MDVIKRHLHTAELIHRPFLALLHYSIRTMKELFVVILCAMFHSVYCDDSGKEYFTQKLDHFDSSNNITWQHRYFYNLHYATPESNVNFIALAGEMGAYLSMISGAETVSYVYYAKLFNATLYALDQRFYGDSRPTEDTSIDNLKYLTSRQAIEDIAEFIRQKNEEKGGEQKWIVVGGGYAGNLAAWSRMLHPQLISGAIASSAPIEAKLDFYGYFQALDKDFSDIGGLCYKQISEGLNEATEMFESPQGRADLSSIFQVKPPFSEYDVSENDISLFYAHVISPFIFAAQNNNPTVPQLCDRFTSKGDRYDPLLALRDINPYLHMNVNFNYTANVEKFGKTNYGDNVESRLWMYQRCAEFGFIQSSNTGDNVFGQTQSSNLFIDYCQDLFGISAEDIQRNVDATNKLYGGKDYFTGTNVIFTHGTVDPWTPLTKTNDPKHWSVIIAEIEVEISDNVGKRPQLYDPLVTSTTDNLSSDQLSRSKRIVKEKAEEMSPNVVESFIEQSWDHFNVNEERTFKQRFWQNIMFRNANAPNFLMIGSNDGEDFFDIQDETLPWMNYAKTVGANIFLLEHRYYGESKLGTNFLQYLTSSQMIYDIATFIRTQQVKFNRTGAWITWLCSLSVWSREWFPELINGAVASSSPMLLKNDFYEYLHIVEEVIGNESQFCFDRIADSFDQLRKQSMDPEGRKIIEDKFNVVPSWRDDVVSTLDMNTFFFNLYSIFTSIIEGNTGNDVKMKICYFFENTITYTNSVDALRAVQENLYNNSNVETSRSYDELVDSYSKMLDFIDCDDCIEMTSESRSDLLWLWQTCTEFGFHFTTDYGSSIFALPVPLNFHVSMCERIFNLTMDGIESGIALSLYNYGGRDKFNTTNVVFTNGEEDPWKALGITEQANLDESVVPIVIQDAFHSFDMRRPDPSDSPSLIAARKEILDNIKNWIESSKTAEVPMSTTKRTIGTTTSHSLTTTTLHPISTTSSTSTYFSTTSSSSPFSSLFIPILLTFVVM